MTKLNSMYYRLAAAFTIILNAVLLLSANTNSCWFVHQPKAPSSIQRFSKIK